MLGLDPRVAGDQLRRRIGSQLQDAALPDRMRVHEALELFASLHPSPQPLDELADEWQLTHLAPPALRAPCRAASASGCSSRWRWSAARSSCSSTSSPRTSTRSAAATRGT